MPIYEYECSGCKGNFEFMQKITENPYTECTECGGELTRLISLSSFHLKGTGWYKTDYGSKSSGPNNGKSDQKTDGEKSETKATNGEKTESKKIEGEKPKSESKVSSDSKP